MGVKKSNKSTSRRYSADEVLASLMEDSDSDSYSDISENSSTSSDTSQDIHQNHNTYSHPEQPKTYSTLETYTERTSQRTERPSPVIPTPSPSPPPVNLESTSDTSYPPSSDPTSSSSYSSSPSIKSSPTFPSDDSTSSNPSPVFKISHSQMTHEESDSDSLQHFDIYPKCETVSKKRALFHVAEVPFGTLAQMVKAYLHSIEKDPSKPSWPVPDMDRNQKRNFRRKADKFKIINGTLRHQHVYVDEKNKTKRGKITHLTIILDFSFNFNQKVTK